MSTNSGLELPRDELGDEDQDVLELARGTAEKAIEKDQPLIARQR